MECENFGLAFAATYWAVSDERLVQDTMSNIKPGIRVRVLVSLACVLVTRWRVLVTWGRTQDPGRPEDPAGLWDPGPGDQGVSWGLGVLGTGGPWGVLGTRGCLGPQGSLEPGGWGQGVILGVSGSWVETWEVRKPGLEFWGSLQTGKSF